MDLALAWLLSQFGWCFVAMVKVWFNVAEFLDRYDSSHHSGKEHRPLSQIDLLNVLYGGTMLIDAQGDRQLSEAADSARKAISRALYSVLWVVLGFLLCIVLARLLADKTGNSHG